MTTIPTRFLVAVRHPAVWLPVLLLTLMTLLSRYTDADLAVARLFFSGEAGATPITSRWPMMLQQPWKGLYEWGVYPALFIGVGGLLVWIVSFVWTKLEPWRDPGLFLALVLIIGPGLLVNGLLKPFWSRPRPNAVQTFHGPREFLPVFQRGDRQQDASFPSGHAAMGFYLMVPAFVCFRRSRRWATAFLLMGLSGGLIIGLARIVAGGHFASDVVWSGGVVYFTALLLAVPFRFGERPESELREAEFADDRPLPSNGNAA